MLTKKKILKSLDNFILQLYSSMKIQYSVLVNILIDYIILNMYIELR